MMKKIIITVLLCSIVQNQVFAMDDENLMQQQLPGYKAMTDYLKAKFGKVPTLAFTEEGKPVNQAAEDQFVETVARKLIDANPKIHPLEYDTVVATQAPVLFREGFTNPHDKILSPKYLTQAGELEVDKYKINKLMPDVYKKMMNLQSLRPLGGREFKN